MKQKEHKYMTTRNQQSFRKQDTKAMLNYTQCPQEVLDGLFGGELCEAALEEQEAYRRG